ncbi:hypothetical protein AMAG_11402 [Allomyces macrogynus ATCC 38327]|uniref:Ketoreductase domain-containing protein n=1 Tax=Allomyces macrogynus (strain ATCC 38327) TaxID=578462 RepID=A0A0L0SWN9_ALLM3|nr:hypothetical protein AMAG_11402 [Allomyces macrogynus ATCC 38327]|eukprot:KNE66927.1 hypothetical protein AMAG_11402 [Allomyces macrogynus ATCC 38327]
MMIASIRSRLAATAATAVVSRAVVGRVAATTVAATRSTIARHEYSQHQEPANLLTAARNTLFTVTRRAYSTKTADSASARHRKHHFSLHGKTVFITGASSGIGASCARFFADEGANLVLTARRVDRLANLKNELATEYPEVKVHVAALDVVDRDAVFRAVAELPDQFKNVKVLVNNAGLSLGLEPMIETTPEDANTMLDTNVRGVFNVTQAIVPGMITRGAGHVITIGSVAGRQPYANGAMYCASKHAVEAMSHALTQELVKTPVRVTMVAPGMVETEFSVVRFHGDEGKAKAVYDGLDPLTPDDIADLVVFAATRPKHVQRTLGHWFGREEAGTRGGGD